MARLRAPSCLTRPGAGILPRFRSGRFAPFLALEAALRLVFVILLLSASVSSASDVTVEVEPEVEVDVANIDVNPPVEPPEAEADVDIEPTDPSEDSDEETDEAESGVDAEAEAESHEPSEDALSGHRYTADISDEELERLWTTEPESLGSMSVGFADAGRMINAVPCRTSEHWTIVSPAHCWGTSESLEFIYTGIEAVAAAHPGSRAIRLNHISSKDGGWLRPHFSHQSGRDVDLGFYYKEELEYGSGRRRETQIDLARNWTLVKTFITQTDLQVILVDRRISKVLHAYALEQGEDAEWLETVFNAGKKSLVRHARGHHDHFHVRFYNARAQELGRRIVPLLAQQPEHNFAMHRVKSGNTLGHIARQYGATVRSIQKANGMKNSFLRIGRVLKVPLRKPCTRCPLPPEVVVPDRCLPPEKLADSTQAVDAQLAPAQPEDGD